MKAKYIGVSFGVDGLTNEKVYEILEVDELTGAFRVVDDSGEDYLYDTRNPRPIAVTTHPGGHWELIEDDEKQTLRHALLL